MYLGLHVKYPFFLSDFNGNLIFSTTSRTALKIQNFIEIRPVGAELFHADGRTNGHDEASSRLSQFLRKALKNTTDDISNRG